ncbi:hypothetical protein B296_00055010, partial [Ensete ventricosum]
MYQSARLSVHGPTATGRYRQNRPLAVDRGRNRLSAVDRGKIRKKKKRKRRKKKRRRRKMYLLSSRRPRPCVVAARGSPARRRHPHPRAIFLLREEKDRGD